MRGDKPIRLLPEEIEHLKMVCKIIQAMDIQQRAHVVNEVLMLSPMCAWDEETKILHSIESVTVNGQAVQLNIGECAHA